MFIKNKTGQSVVEFMLMVPILCFMVLSAIELGFLGIRKILVERSFTRASRVADVYQPRLMESEINEKVLPRGLFKEGNADIENGGQILMEASFETFTNIRPFINFSPLKGQAFSQGALAKGYSTQVLQGGDTPLPYCSNLKGYESCDYPK